MEVDHTEVSFFDDLKFRVIIDTITSYFGFFFTFFLTILAVLAIVQHYVNPPKRLLLPGNEVYMRVARFKLIAISIYFFLYFGFKAEIIYPCCDMVNIHFRSLFPVINTKLYFIMWTSTVMISRFANVAFLVKRLDANIRGMWFPSFTSLALCHTCSIGIGILLYILYNYWSDVDMFNMDSTHYCSYFGADICNKYTIEEDRRHFHIDFRYIALLRIVNLWHLITSAVWICVYSFKVLLATYDIHFMGAIIDKESDSYKKRQEILTRQIVQSLLVFVFHMGTSFEVFFNFPSSESISSSSLDFAINHIWEPEYFALLDSENYYHLPHIASIISNLRNGRKWNENVKHPRGDFSDEDYY